MLRTILILSILAALIPAQAADLILHNGRIVTVDNQFTIAQAVAVSDGEITLVGDNQRVLQERNNTTRVIDLQGKMVLPGLIDSHVHPGGACMTEWDHPIPNMESIADVLDYIRARAKVLPEDQWIIVSQVFITRLRERRYPTRDELDAAAPRHAVVFRTGPDASFNSLALKKAGIDKDFKTAGSGRVEKDPSTGEPTGILRTFRDYVDLPPDSHVPSEQDHLQRLQKLITDYNSVGLTAFADRNASDEAMKRYRHLEQEKRLTIRVAASRSLNARTDRPTLRKRLATFARERETSAQSLARTVGVKIFLDGGMLTGSAYMRKPWGVSKIYSIDDPAYRGLRFVDQEQLVTAVQETVRAKLQFTAHSVGDGAVHALLDAYAEVSKTQDIKATRPCITHCNFMSREAVDEMAALGVVADIQPAWLYLDTSTLQAQFGYDRLRYFQPLATAFRSGVIGGGSDHMQKIGSMRAINPYNPFFGMWVAITRKARWYDQQLHPEEALSREQAIRFYTRNNAFIIFRENEIGSIELGKRADMVVIDRDLLNCDVDQIKDTKVLRTFFNGKQVGKR